MGYNKGISVYSEIGKLKTVLMHPPGKEVESILQDNLRKDLFNEALLLEQALREHKEFQGLLKGEGVEGVYLQDLAEESLKSEESRKEFIKEYIKEEKIVYTPVREALEAYLESLSLSELLKVSVEGMAKESFNKRGRGFFPKTANPQELLTNIVKDKYPYYLTPIPNLFFQRDLFSSIGSGVSLNIMSKGEREKETIFSKYIFKYHPSLKEVKTWYSKGELRTVEGGDILVLSSKVVAIGLSERTEAEAVEALASNILYSEEGFEKVLVFDIPKSKRFILLDMIFTMVDFDKFLFYGDLKNNINLYILERSAQGSLKARALEYPLEEALKKQLSLPAISLIYCGGEDVITAAREQKFSGANSLCISPGKVITYERNHGTNRALRKSGVEVIELEAYELPRGGGGPRCMTMPLWRETL